MPSTAYRGQVEESRAAEFLGAHGLKLVERNWRCRGGEIDLIMHDGKVLVFVEVRSRSNPNYGGAAASITATKQARIIHAARQYLARLGTVPPCRFDAVLIHNARIEWLRDAFQAES